MQDFASQLNLAESVVLPQIQSRSPHTLRYTRMVLPCVIPAGLWPWCESVWRKMRTIKTNFKTIKPFVLDGQATQCPGLRRVRDWLAFAAKEQSSCRGLDFRGNFWLWTTSPTQSIKSHDVDFHGTRRRRGLLPWITNNRTTTTTQAMTSLPGARCIFRCLLWLFSTATELWAKVSHVMRTGEIEWRGMRGKFSCLNNRIFISKSGTNKFFVDAA